jgi:hypothetical protein
MGAGRATGAHDCLWTPVKLSIVSLPAVIALVVTLRAAPASRQFTGVITDSMCLTGDHSGMRMGPTDAECTIACINAHGAVYVLYDGKEAWTLSDQTTPEKFAGKKVIVVGTQDAKAKTIKVQSISLAK